MAKRPSCCLYLSFLIHFTAFASLLVGYSTPNWTLIKMSTGEVRLLGLVVSCDRLKCDTLHVTSARRVFVIIFGMCTFCILLSLFAIQTFCLALCNRSCKEKNIGTCLSYFSLFIAFCIGATLGLYQIDLKEEDKPDVMAMWMGWSQYCIMGAAGGFFLGAWLNAADYCLRNRARNRELLKRTAEIKAKVVSQSMAHGQNRAGDVNINSLRPDQSRKSSLAERRMQYANRDKWRTPIEKNRESQSPRMLNAVECAVRSQTKNRDNIHRGGNDKRDRLQKSTTKNNTLTVGGNPNVDKRLVQMAKEHRVKSINVKEAPRISVTTGSAGARSSRVNQTSDTTALANESKKSVKREEKVEFSDAALKYRLERLHQLTTPCTNDERRKLSAVQEEEKRSSRENSTTPHEKSTTPKEKRVLNRQETKTLVGHSLLQSTASMSLDIDSNNTNLNNIKQDKSEKDSKQLVKQISVESRTYKTRDSDNTLPEIKDSNISRHTKPHPLQRDGQISSQETSFGSNTKLRQTRKTSRSLDSSSNRLSRDEVIPPIKKDPKTECAEKKDNITLGTANTSGTNPLPKMESKTSVSVESNKIVTTDIKPSGGSVVGQNQSLQSQDSLLNTSELSEDQIKRRQIVESILLAKKDRKKKRITQ